MLIFYSTWNCKSCTASASTVNSALGKHGEGTTAQGILKNDILNNIKRPDNLTGLSENDSVKVSKSGAYKRRSPASAMLNPLPQQFYDTIYCRS
jgi:hypothetical protein